MENQTTQKENVLFGAVGAFLFSLVGGVAYFLLYQFGFIAGLSGLIGVVCAIKGYEIFAKGSSSKGIVIAIVMAALSLIAAWYLCLSYDVYNAFIAWEQEGLVDYLPTFFECVSIAYEFLADVPEYFSDLAISLVLAVVGSAKYLIDAFKAKKNQNFNSNAYDAASQNDAQNDASSDASSENNQQSF